MPARILMVCLGNICRSPLAEGIMASRQGTAGIYVDSAGTGGYHIGNPPDPRSVAVAARHGIDISKQRCRQFRVSDFDGFDYIFVMDQSNLRAVRGLARSDSDRSKVRLLLEAGGQGAQEVPDPYYGGDVVFEDVYQMIGAACDHILSHVVK